MALLRLCWHGAKHNQNSHSMEMLGYLMKGTDPWLKPRSDTFSLQTLEIKITHFYLLQ